MMTTTSEKPPDRSVSTDGHSGADTQLEKANCGLISPINPPSGASDSADLVQLAGATGVPGLHRHIFLCTDATKPKCCAKEVSLQSWEYLKRRLKELRLAGPGGTIHRTKANCLNICACGPIAVVYPEGI